MVLPATRAPTNPPAKASLEQDISIYSCDYLKNINLPGTVGVNNLGRLQNSDWEGLDSWLARGGSSNNSWLSSLGDNNDSVALVVDLWKLSNSLGNLSNVLGLQSVGLGVGESLRLVSNEEIGVWEDRVQLILEELWDEWSGKVDGEDLVLLGSVLTEGEDGWHTDGQMVTSDVVDLSSLNERPDLWGLQVLKLVVVGSAEVGDEGTVDTSDDGSALSGSNLLVDSVGGLDTLSLVALAEDLGVLIITDTADVDDRLWWENVGSSASRVLSGSSWDEQWVVLGNQLLVDWLVLVFNEDGIVSLELVLVEELLVSVDLDV